MTSSLLTERTQGAFPVSIGTSLALESIMDGIQPPYDPERVIPQRIKLTDYTEYWFNIETLFRNILGSLNTNNPSDVKPAEVLAILFEEIEMIKQFVFDECLGTVRFVPYRNVHGRLASKHPHGKLRMPTTPKQMEYASFCENVCGHAVKQSNGVIQEFDRVLSGSGKKVLITTHMPYDLLSYGKFDSLELLESHTGVLKPRSQWHTKLTAAKTLARMPFNAMTIQVFGDSTTFAPLPQAARQQVIELSEEKKWHALATRDLIVYSLKGLKDVFAAKVYQEMLYEF